MTATMLTDSDRTTTEEQQPGTVPVPEAAGSWRSGWSALVVTVIARMTLAIMASLLVWSVVPSVIGWHSTVVRTGSMLPRLHVGDVVVSRPVPAGSVHLQQVLLVVDPDHPGRTRLHRYVRANPDGTLTLRGDANPGDDSTPVRPAAVRGVASLRIPLIGHPLVWIATRSYGPLLGLLLALIALAAAATSFRPGAAAASVQSDENDENDTPTSPTTEDQSGSRISPATGRRRLLRRTVVTVIGSLTVIGVMGTGVAAAAVRFPARTANPTDNWNSAAYFTCQPAILADNPRAYFQLQDTAGSYTAADSSGNYRPGTYQRGPNATGIAYSQPGACPRDPSTGIALDGSSGYLVAGGQMTNPQVFTTEVWFKTVTKSGGVLISFGSGSSGASQQRDRIVFMTNDGHLSYGINPGVKTVLTTPSAYNDGHWHLVDASLSGAGMALSVDGATVATAPASTTAENITGTWRFGYEDLTNWTTAATSSYFAGSLDEASIYTSALPAGHIANHYAAGTP